MKVLDPGHLYELHMIDRQNDVMARPIVQHLQFVKREGAGYPGNVGHYTGTQIQDVLRCCIDRLKYVDKQVHHDVNWLCITALRSVIFMLEMRAAERHGKNPLPPVRYQCEHEDIGDNGHWLIGAGTLKGAEDVTIEHEL